MSAKYLLSKVAPISTMLDSSRCIFLHTRPNTREFESTINGKSSVFHNMRLSIWLLKNMSRIWCFSIKNTINVSLIVMSILILDLSKLEVNKLTMEISWQICAENIMTLMPASSIQGWSEMMSCRKKED